MNFLKHRRTIKKGLIVLVAIIVYLVIVSDHVEFEVIFVPPSIIFKFDK